MRKRGLGRWEDWWEEGADDARAERKEQVLETACENGRDVETNECAEANDASLGGVEALEHLCGVHSPEPKILQPQGDFCKEAIA